MRSNLKQKWVKLKMLKKLAKPIVRFSNIQEMKLFIKDKNNVLTKEELSACIISGFLEDWNKQPYEQNTKIEVREFIYIDNTSEQIKIILENN